MGAIINSRPITAKLIDSNDIETLTPNHILHMKSEVILPPPGTFQWADIYMRERWRRVEYAANIFWTRWRREYLLTLQDRQKWNRSHRNKVEGEISIIKDDWSLDASPIQSLIVKVSAEASQWKYRHSYREVQ